MRLLFIVLLLVSCTSKENSKEVPFQFKAKQLEIGEKIHFQNNKEFLGTIHFKDEKTLHLFLPDSTSIIAIQQSPSTRNFYLSEDNFLIFRTKNYQTGFALFDKYEKKLPLWQVKFKDNQISITNTYFAFTIKMPQAQQIFAYNKEGKIIGNATIQNNKALFYKSQEQKPAFECSIKSLSPAFAILLLEEISVEERYALFAETLARGY